MNIFSYISSLFSKKENAERTVSAAMETEIATWVDMYEHGSNSEGENRNLELPACISHEFARLMLAESKVHIDGDSDRAKYIDDQMQAFMHSFSEQAEIACALGSMAFKPYISGDKIVVDLVRADRYLPTSFDDSGAVNGAIFMARKQIKKMYYTRLESHTFDANSKSYTVSNRAYCSVSAEYLGTPCSLQEVDVWEMLQEEQTIANVEKPLFAVFKIPSANNIDIDSPLGVSVYSRAKNLIDDANSQWDKITWEYNGSELALDVSMDLLTGDKRSKSPHKMPKGKKRLFRSFDVDDTADLSKLIHTYSPAIRDASLFNGLNHILQRIEFNVGLAYGTISEPMDTEKTAEEIRTSKQRSYVQVSSMQSNLQDALEHLRYIMDVYASLYNLSPDGDSELSCTWGDSVLEDTDKEFARRLQMASANILKKEKLIAWYFGCSEDEAAEYIPDVQNDGGLFSGGI